MMIPLALLATTLANLSLAADPSPSPSPSPSAPTHLSIEDPIPGAIMSIYSDKIQDVLKHWPRADIPSVDNLPNRYWMTAVRTPGNKDFMGMIKRMYINAPLERYAAALAGYPDYPKIMKGLNYTRVVEESGNLSLVAWERDIPIPLVPNLRYQTYYVTEQPRPGQWICRYQLKWSNTLKSSDGLLILEKHGKGTLFTAFDFFNGNWGAARLFAPNRLWDDSLTGAYTTDITLRFRAENPDWETDKVREEALKYVKAHPILPVKYEDEIKY